SDCARRRIARSSYRSLMFLREAADFFLDAQNGASPVLGNLLQNAQVLQRAGLRGGNFLGRGATVEIADESPDGSKAHRIGVTSKITSSIAHFRNEPHAHETAFDTISF